MDPHWTYILKCRSNAYIDSFHGNYLCFKIRKIVYICSGPTFQNVGPNFLTRQWTYILKCGSIAYIDSFHINYPYFKIKIITLKTIFLCVGPTF